MEGDGLLVRGWVSVRPAHKEGWFVMICPQSETTNASDKLSMDPGKRLGRKYDLGKKDTATKQGPEANCC